MLQKSRHKLHDYDFEYIFFEEDKMKYLDLCINATDKILHDDHKWLRKEVTKLGISYTLQQLQKVDLGCRAEEGDKFHYNKVTWAKLFMK